MQFLILNREDILLLHDLILSVSPGRPGILHDGYIESALQRPHTYMQYEELDLHTLAALILDSLARNHAFKDGNKRTALLCAIYVYAINGTYLNMSMETNDEFEELALWVVKNKPSIIRIRSRLMKLVEKHELGSFEKFKLAIRSLFA